MPKQQKIDLDISWSALLKVVALGLGILAALALRDVLLMLFVVFIFVAAVNPTIATMQKSMSRTLAVILFFVLLLAGFILLIYIFVPNLLHQINELRNNYPAIVEKVKPYLSGEQGQAYLDIFKKSLDNIGSTVQDLSGNAFQTFLTVFGGLATAVTGLILSFYILLEEKNAKDFFHQVLPHYRFKAVYTTLSKISEKMGSWVRGQILLMLLIGAANFIAFLAIGVPSPLPLAIWAGLCEALPYIGPFLGMVPAILICLVTGNILGAILVFGVSFILIQQVEGNIIVPRVMGKAIGLSPVLVILALVIGTKLFGLLGAIISIPTAAIVSVIVGEWPNLRAIWEDSSVEAESAAVEI
jgi:predicted PurR-regulated permease PerM